MVDREARVRYAEMLRHEASGVITENELPLRCEGIPSNIRDRGMRAVANGASDILSYDREGTPDGRLLLHGEARKALARLVLFLYTDQEYAWPDTSFEVMDRPTAGLLMAWFGPMVAGFLVGTVWTPAAFVGLVIGIICGIRAEWPMWKALGIDIWPFASEEAFAEARCHPRLLAGNVHPR